MYVSAIRKKQRQDTIAPMIPCLLCYMAHWGNRCVRAYRESVYARTQRDG